MELPGNSRVDKCCAGRHDTGADLYEDEAMRMLAVVAGFGAVIGVATPAGPRITN
jgi:hypothetical protein